MSVQQDSIHVMEMQHARIMLAHTHVHAIVDSVETEVFAKTLMSVQQHNIHVMEMQHVQIMLAHTHVHAIVDSVETEVCART